MSTVRVYSFAMTSKTNAQHETAGQATEESDCLGIGLPSQPLSIALLSLLRLRRSCQPSFAVTRRMDAKQDRLRVARANCLPD